MDFDRTAEYVQHHSEEEGVKQRKMIWRIFWVLLGITSVEVGLGLYYKELGIAWPIVKWTFIFLTLLKAYYIVAFYMHLKHEFKHFIYAVIAPYVVLIIYLILLALNEALYLYDADKLL